MAFAAVISLKHTIERLTNPSNPEITKSAYDELKLLERVLIRLDTSRNSSNRREIKALDAKIREAVCELEDVVESDMLHQSLPSSHSLADEGVKQEMESLMEPLMESLMKKMNNLREEYIRKLDSPLTGKGDDAASPMDDAVGNKSTMVGLLDKFEKVRQELLDSQLELKTVSLFGMAGIGKTLLAREIYQLPITIENFRLRLWVTLGPRHDIERGLKDIAAQIKRQLGNDYVKDDTMSLREQIYKNLFGRRYFIVLDNIWNKQTWDALRNWFPTEKRGSRLLLTTRLEEVAKYPTKSSVHEMRFLKHEESWNLLCLNVFGEEISPRELEKPGRKIAEQCEGLPLLILEVARLLSRGKMDPDYWTIVGDKRNEIFTDAYENISEVLFSSYEYLSQYLKACFLYMAAFPLNYEIPLPKLINMWIAEDILEPNESETLEGFAVKCLEKLISQSLVIVSKHSSNDDTIKSSKLHSTYWHLCVVEARKDKSLHVFNYLWDFEESINSQRRLSVQNNVLFSIKEVYDSMATALTARSLLFTGQDHQYPVPICSNLMFLKVLDALAIRFYEFPDEVLKLLRLKYLALTHNGDLPSFISELQNLQSLIVRQHHNIKRIKDSTRLPKENRETQRSIQSTCLPKEIWDMQELRYLRIMGSNLPDPSNDAKLPNLLTLHVKGQSCTEKVFRNIPKLKKLGIKIELQPRSTEILNCFEHISILQELESLKCFVVNPRLRSQVVAPPNCFPEGLIKLSLNGIGYSWENMTVIGTLQKLRVLKLRCSAFRGPEWKTKAEEFPMLEFLLLEDIDLKHWTTEDDDCFSTLKRLVIRHCYRLEEIPSSIGELPTLERVEVFDSNPLVVASADEIKQKEKDNGNESLQVLATSPWDL